MKQNSLRGKRSTSWPAPMPLTATETHCSFWRRLFIHRDGKPRCSRTFARRFVCTSRKATSSQPNGQRRCCSREQSQNEEEPQPGLFHDVQIHYTQPVLPLPQASRTSAPEPMWAMLVDGTAASARIASAEAI